MRNMYILVFVVGLTALFVCSCGDSGTADKIAKLESRSREQERNDTEHSSGIGENSTEIEGLKNELKLLKEALAAKPDRAEIKQVVQEEMPRVEAGRRGQDRRGQDRRGGVRNRWDDELKKEMVKAGLTEDLAAKALEIRSDARRKRREVEGENREEKLKKINEDTEAALKEALGEDGLKKYKKAEEERANNRVKPMAEAVGIDIPTARKVSEVSQRVFNDTRAEMRKACEKKQEVDFRKMFQDARKKAEEEVKKLLNDDAKFEAYKKYREEQIQRFRGRRGGRRGGDRRQRDDGRGERPDAQRGDDKPAAGGGDRVF